MSNSETCRLNFSFLPISVTSVLIKFLKNWCKQLLISTLIQIVYKTSINQPNNRQTTHQPTNQQMNQSINELINQSIYQSTNQSINQSINRLFDRSIDQSINPLCFCTTSHGLLGTDYKSTPCIIWVWTNKPEKNLLTILPVFLNLN